MGGLTHPFCRNKNSLDGLTAIFSYKGIVAKGISRLKSRFITDLADEVVEMFVSSCGEDRWFVNYCQRKNIVLVPLPIPLVRKKWRGFSQTELLGKLIARNLSFGFAPGLIKRTKNAWVLAGINEIGRQKKARDGFLPGNLSGLNIILFNDLWVSGSALKVVGRVLKEAGTKTVWGLTLAR